MSGEFFSSFQKLYNPKQIPYPYFVIESKTSTTKKRELSDFAIWADIFRGKIDRGDLFPWTDSYRLSPDERDTIAASIAQFELGENAQGRSFKRAAERYIEKSGDHDYMVALTLFIQEEQRHSSYLRRFMVDQGLPLEPAHWVDGTFRKLRKLAGLEFFIVVLITAEIIAIPYYKSLREATESKLLKAICREILRDEADHLSFQGNALRKLRANQSWMRVRMTEIVHHLLLIGTCLVVWLDHGKVLKRGGFGLPGFIRSSRKILESFHHLTRRPLHSQPVECAPEPPSPLARAC